MAEVARLKSLEQVRLHKISKQKNEMLNELHK
jgi:hypothetical protein